MNDLVWPWRAIMHSVSKHMRLSEPTKIWMKTESYYRQRRCSPMTLVCGNIRFMRIFAGVPWRKGSNDNGVIENVDFQGFRTLRLRHLRKWGQHYYVALFGPSSPFRWPQNTWPWMTLNDHSTLNFYYYEQAFDKLFYTLTVESVYTRDQRRCADLRKWTVIRRIFGIRGRTADFCGSFVDATSSEP